MTQDGTVYFGEELILEHGFSDEIMTIGIYEALESFDLYDYHKEFSKSYRKKYLCDFGFAFRDFLVEKKLIKKKQSRKLWLGDGTDKRIVLV